MAVDEFYSQEVQSLISGKKAFYPFKIPINHWQLRHLVTSPEPDVLYYAAHAAGERSERNKDIYRLNTKTRTRTLIAQLPFYARCTASGYGYVCIGGEDAGHLAILDLKGSQSSAVDESLPLFTETRRSALSGNDPLLGSRPSVRVEKIGEDIVNCVSIHQLADCDGEVVAILSNNDKTVRIYSLRLNQEVTVIDFRFPINHASISPNGQYLVAVGDYNQATFFKRKTTNRLNSGKVDSRCFEWNIVDVVTLYIPSTSSTQGYFTTAWSPSGTLCAVGSEAGYISILDVDMVTECRRGQDAIVKVISSSRPNSIAGPGAIRTMCFAPSPWDLLIWCEDQGRVCIGDLRTGLTQKQVIELDVKDTVLPRIELIDKEPESLDQNRYDWLEREDMLERYRLGQESANRRDQISMIINRLRGNENEHQGLTDEERAILSGLRTTRQRAEAQEQGVIPRSINYLPPPATRSPTASQPPQLPPIGTFRTSTDSQENTRSEFDHSPPPWRRVGYGDDSQRDRLHLARQILRLQASTSRFMNDTNNPTRPSSSSTPAPAGATTDRTPPPRPYAVNPQARYERSTILGSMNPEEAAAEIRRARQVARAREATGVRNPSLLADLYSQAIAEDRYMVAGYAGVGRPNPAFGVRTAGVVVSQDGRTLYVGTEEGIFEMEIDVRARMFMGAEEWR